MFSNFYLNNYFCKNCSPPIKNAPPQTEIECVKPEIFLYFFPQFLFVERELFKKAKKDKRFCILSLRKKQSFLN